MGSSRLDAAPRKNGGGSGGGRGGDHSAGGGGSGGGSSTWTIVGGATIEWWVLYLLALENMLLVDDVMLEAVGVGPGDWCSRGRRAEELSVDQWRLASSSGD